MTMKNRELFEKDPRSHSLLNQGVAKITPPETSEELDTLRYELTNFVCEGQYEQGLVRILSTFLGHLDKPEQPGVWVSGFFGSGKSHLVKMLHALWSDYAFADGAKARGLARLPATVTDLLKELNSAAKRHGGLHAVAGDLRTEANTSIRLALLGILFKSVGLRSDYSRACFQMWLRDEGLETGVREFIAQAGGDFDRELTNLFVSPLMARALLARRPDFAREPTEVLALLKAQFPNDPQDISTDKVVDCIRRALSRNGKLPLTLIVLDEVQQFINDDPQRSKDVQDLKDLCISRLGASVMLVATGQNALSGTALLQRLQGRFPVTVELQDTDVEQVTREVILKKKSSAEPELKRLLENHSGEIERQLASTKIAFTTRDRALLTQDYPILPVRRRFWERVLRAVDKAGTGAQLRNQLWVVYDAVQQTSEWPLGRVVNGAFIYDASIKGSALKSGVLLQEIAETIERQKKEDDGELRHQLCALIFLIGQLPHNNEPLDAGIRADAETLADLLVTDLTGSSAELRRKIPELLEKLVTSGAIMRVENEYRMQTREGSEWNQMFLEARNRLLNDPGKLASERSQLLRSRCGELLKKCKVLQGTSRESRRIEPHFGDTAPPTDQGAIPVWIRDGWEVEEKTVLNEARAAGDTTAMVLGHIPKKMAEELKQVLATHYAATTTLQTKGTPSSDEGIQARKAMETRQEQAQKNRDTLLTDILNEVQVFLAGGDPVGGTLLPQKVEEGAKLCCDRLYPLFHLADSADWHKVLERAKKGDGGALQAIGHKGDPESHPVCKAVLEHVGSGRRGTDIRRHFGAGKYGWPQDAIDAALVVLVQAGAVQARHGSETVTAAKLDQKLIGNVEFRTESVTLSKVQLIGIRTLYKQLGFTIQPGQESTTAAEFLGRAQSLAAEAGGDAPRPAPPDTRHLTDIANRVGNDQLKALFDAKEELTRQFAAWQTARDGIVARLPAWNRLSQLLEFAQHLPVAAEIRPEIEAIERERTLLASPDPVPGLIEKLSAAVRAELNQLQAQLTSDHEARLETLTESAAWKQIPQPDRHKILGDLGLRGVPKIAVGSPDEIVTTLKQTNLSQLADLRDALPRRFQQAAAAAATLLEPKAHSVALPGRTIQNAAELDAWLDEVKTLVLRQLSEGPVIL
jgi:hypothetical protein